MQETRLWHVRTEIEIRHHWRFHVRVTDFGLHLPQIYSKIKND
jgi:hypothetical protein